MSNPLKPASPYHCLDTSNKRLSMNSNLSLVLSLKFCSFEMLYNVLDRIQFIYCIVSYLDKHNRLTGLNIEKDRIELWEESKDGSGKVLVDQNSLICINHLLIVCTIIDCIIDYWSIDYWSFS